MIRYMCSAVVLAVALPAAAIDFTKYSDLAFAEEYAFSTNRAELISRLRHDTGPWYFYSLLNLQTERRFDEAVEFVKKAHRDGATGTQEAWNDLQLRQMFCNWENALGKPRTGGRTPDEFLAWDLACFCDIRTPHYVRQVEAQPHTYPSELDQKRISFQAYCDEFMNRTRDAFEDRFLFLAFSKALNRPDWFDRMKEYTPETPGFYEALLKWVADNGRVVFTDESAFQCLTLRQLEALQHELCDVRGLKDFAGSERFVKLVLEKLGPGPEEDVENDPDAKRRVLDRQLKFLRTTTEAHRDKRLETIRAILELERARGRFTEKKLFLEYVAQAHQGARRRFLSTGDFEKDYLIAFRQGGSRLDEFAKWFEPERLAAIRAEGDLLSGIEPAKEDLAKLTHGDYRKIVDRTELVWSAANPVRFASDAGVSLAIDVKNVKKMRVAIYELDAYAATVKLGAEVKRDVDLDGCVPGVERTLDYAKTASAVRHREMLTFPELKKPGLYVVECSGGGLSSRALVRKGTLRIGERIGAGGHVFTVMDEKGDIVKPARLRLGTTTFASDERGEIAVPFAAAKEAGTKDAVIGAGALAVLHRFKHCAETYELKLGGALPAEMIVAGTKAKAVLRPRLEVSGSPASLDLLENPRLELVLTDLDKVTSTRRLDGLKLSENAEIEFPFTVPSRLADVRFTLTGTVRNVSEAKDVTVSGTCDLGPYNSILETEKIGRAFLRRGSDGYSIELRGRNGEPLAAREARLEFKHLAFKCRHGETLQSDERGVIRLGKLSDITSVMMEKPFKTTWNLVKERSAGLPSALSVAEGESIEFPVRGLADGEWPMANELRARVSLVALNAAGRITADCLEAVAYTNGVLRIEPLPAGDYRLSLRAENKRCTIRVTKTAAKAIAGGLIVGERRGLEDVGNPGRLRIRDAALDAGVLKVTLAKAGGDARVHLLALRFVPDGTDRSSLVKLFDEASSQKAKTTTWTPPRTEFVSGRDLGDKLRYILDRRTLRRRIGNMLDRPSLLLNPWSERETETKELTVRPGEDWKRAAEEEQRRLAAGESRASSPRFGDACYGKSSVRAYRPCFDFLAKPAELWCNLRPDKDGVVTFKVPVGAEFQDFEIVAVGSDGLDGVRLNGKTTDFARRDLRFFAAKNGEGAAPRTRVYSTVEQLRELLGSDENKLMKEFEFVGRWGTLAEEKRRELYGQFASHELDLFLFFKDRAFFDSVVVPNLRNKRFKQFTDRWLLGESLDEYAKLGTLQGLNALEKCLLAKRIPALAKTIADLMDNECAAHPYGPEREDRLLSRALGISEEEPVSYCIKKMEEPVSACAPVAMKSMAGSRSPAPQMELKASGFRADDGWSDQAGMPDGAGMKKKVRAQEVLRLFGGGLANAQADRARRENRQLYRPPERTREWVETHHYHRPHARGSEGLVKVNPFWRDYARAIVDGKDGEFRPTSVMYVEGGLTEALGALAVTALPFEAKDGAGGIAFAERRIEADAKGAQDIGVVRRFLDPALAREDEESGRVLYDHTVEEFVVGRPYLLSTVLSNPTEVPVVARIDRRLPDGAIPLGEDSRLGVRSVTLGDCSMETFTIKFYFPAADEVSGGLAPAFVSAGGVVRGIGEGMTCTVVSKATKVDRTNWQWISQNGTEDEVFAFLAKANLSSPEVDLGMIGWRMKDPAFAKRVFAALSARGVFHEGLWSTALAGRYAMTENAERVRELLMAPQNRKKLAEKLGPDFHCPIVDVDPEEVDLYEHREYWPLINARAHDLGGTATIANESLKKQYRAFLDVLATKKALSAKDRLDAAVYLIAQDRIDEAERMAASVGRDDIATKMQLDYLDAYFAFSRQKPEEGRKIALAYADYPVKLWRDRFRKVIAQADEIAGRGGASDARATDEIAAAPSLELSRAGTDALAVRSRNVKKVVVKAFPTDVEVTFSKNPFGGDAVKSSSAFLKPAWTVEASVGADGGTTIALPGELRGSNLIVEASDDEGRVTSSVTVLSGEVDVQVVKEYGELRVRDGKGRPLAAAYVKVYARDDSGRQVKFHKDGYTDLRGAFDYAGVSTDSEFRPAEFAILVLHDTAGVRTLTAPRP